MCSIDRPCVIITVNSSPDENSSASSRVKAGTEGQGPGESGGKVRELHHAAENRNIEVGVLIRHAPIANRVAEYFEGLKASKQLLPVTWHN
jgi:hypothetical protein